MRPAAGLEGGRGSKKSGVPLKLLHRGMHVFGVV